MTPRDGLGQVWALADEMRGSIALGPYELLREAAQRDIPLTWREVLGLYERLASQRYESPPPQHVLAFIAEVGRQRRASRIADPCATSFVPLWAVSDMTSPTETVGLVLRNTDMAATAQHFAPHIDWHVGEPIELIGHQRGNFDLLLTFPPIGARSDDMLRQYDVDTVVRGEYAWAVLHAAAPLLAENGLAVALLGEGFHFRADADKAREQLAAVGLHVQAVVSVPGALRPASEIDTNLVFFSRTPVDEVFLGRLTPDMDGGQLATNLLRRRLGAQRELGSLLPHGEFRSWRTYEAAALFEEVAAASPFQPVGLGEIAELTTIDTRKIDADSYTPAMNAVYLPEVAMGRPVTSPNVDDGKGRRYTEVRLDPARADARFIATWLDGSLGQLARRAVGAGPAGRTHTPARAYAELRVLLPPLETQRTAIEADRGLTEISLQVADLRERLWTQPEDAPAIVEEIAGVEVGQSLEEWVDNLPFPLASIAYRYFADPAPDAQVERLLHFFEAAAQFAVTVLLSAVSKDDGFFERTRTRLASPDPQGRGPLERSSFGTWTHLGQTLAKLLRSELGSKDAAVDVALLFPTSNPALLSALTSKATWKTLDAARAVRNSRAHGGARSHAEVEAWREQLLALLVDLRAATREAFAHVELVRPGPSHFEGQTFRHDAAERLTGPNPIFIRRPLESGMPLEAARPYLVARGTFVTNALKLLPLFRLRTPVETEENAVYFFNGQRPDGRFDFVSYHFHGAPRDVVDDAELGTLIGALTPPK